MRRILVIRLGALGDFFLSFGPFAAIRERHRGDEITLLTTAPFISLARQAPWFDHVLADARPAWLDLPGLWRLRRTLAGFDFVYDLQTSGRSSRYFRLAGRPPWSGIARGCSHPHANPGRDGMHTLERQREQLRMAGVETFPQPELAWLLKGAVPAVPRPYALLMPGAAPGRERKLWPAAGYGAVAAALSGRGFTVAVLGGAGEAGLAAAIRAVCPAVLDLTGRTSIAELARLAASAVLAVGNDTGPMHVAATVGCRVLVLFSAASDPALTAPRGPRGEWPMVLRVSELAELPAAEVIAALTALLG
jgi:ADP-heptose:LPS heptosyltransferase